MLTVLSVTLAVTLLVGVGAASNGIYGAFSSGWWNVAADTDLAIVEPATEFFPANVTELVMASDDARLNDIEAITTGIEIGGVVVYSEGKIVPSVQIFGIETDDPEFGNYYDQAGRVIDLTVLDDDKVIISEELAVELGVDEGDIIQTSIDNGLGESVPFNVEIVDIYDAQLGRGRENVFRPVPRIVVNIEQIQERLIAEYQDHVTVIKLAFKTVENGGELSRDINDLDIDEKTFPGKEMLQDAIDALDELLKEDRPLSIVYSERIVAADNIKDNIAGIIGVLNLFVFMLNLTALLLIINTQSMNFEDRAYQTAVLRAMGTSRGSIFRIFLVESAIVGVLGSALGLLVGLPYGDWMQGIVNDIFEMPGAENASASINQSVIVGAFMLGILLSISTAALPAWYSSGNSITEELRGIKSTKV
ncbi:MAG: FtsX-like permease family protein, partial [Candidatus Heimdallarchaeota archaeon]|nr:FtsX-like permease family protein [Candidatus Heimdallarchaeota archaeon]